MGYADLPDFLSQDVNLGIEPPVSHEDFMTLWGSNQEYKPGDIGFDTKLYSADTKVHYNDENPVFKALSAREARVASKLEQLMSWLKPITGVIKAVLNPVVGPGIMTLDQGCIGDVVGGPPYKVYFDMLYLYSKVNDTAYFRIPGNIHGTYEGGSAIFNIELQPEEEWPEFFSNRATVIQRIPMICYSGGKEIPGRILVHTGSPWWLIDAQNHSSVDDMNELAQPGTGLRPSLVSPYGIVECSFAVTFLGEPGE